MSDPDPDGDCGWFGRADLHSLALCLILCGLTWALLVVRPAGLDVAEPASTATLDRDGIGRINPNTAEWWELASLPGLGPTLSKRIVEYRADQRKKQGDPHAQVFRSVEDLQRIRGIGPKRSATLGERMVFDATDRPLSNIPK